MGGRAIELILAKQLASSLAVPVLLYDREGTVAFFNEPAEIFLGARLDQADALSTQVQWGIVLLVFYLANNKIADRTFGSESEMV